MATPTDGATAADGAGPALEARVFVGGLPAEMTARDLRDRFARFVADGASSVKLALELLPTKAPWTPRSSHRGVAFLTLSGDGAGDARDKLVKTFNRTKWRGSVLRVEPARPHYLAKLRQEWQAQSVGTETAAAAATSVAPSDKPLRMAAPFAGKRTTRFAEVEEGEPLLSPYEEGQDEEQEEDNDSGGSTSQDDDESGDEEETDSGSDDASDASASEQEETREGEEDEQEAIGEDDIEQFVRQMEAEASSLEASVERSDSATTRGDGEDDETARAKANARRVAALAARQQLRQQKEQQQRLLVAAAVSTGTKSKKITFDDDGEAQEHHDDGDEEPTDLNASGGRLVTDWLDSDSEKEGDDEDEERVKAMDPEDRELLPLRADSKKSTLDFFNDKDAHERGEEANEEEEDQEVAKAFALRPEFLGESGKKLFEMQKRFGGDQRFRLDARFMEEDEFAAGNDDAVDDGEAMEDEELGEMQTFLDEDGRDDAAARELAWQAEQDTALAVIEKLFPDLDVAKIKHRLRVQATKDPIKEASWMGRMKRYDPRDASSRREFEISMEDSKGRQRSASDDAEGDDAARRKAERENKPVLVGGDRFFATSSSLGSLFTRVRKNSEDGMEGEAALDGVFGFGNKAADDGDADGDGADAGGASAFKLSSLFDFPVEEEKKIASMGELLLEQDDDYEEGSHNEPWHFTQAFQNADDAPEGEEDVETDGEGDDDDTGGDTAKTKAKTKNKRSLEDFLAFGRTFLRSDGGDFYGKDWAERRKKLTLDFKRKRRDALKTKKKQQQQFAKQKKPRRV